LFWAASSGIAPPSDHHPAAAAHPARMVIAMPSATVNRSFTIAGNRCKAGASADPACTGARRVHLRFSAMLKLPFKFERS